MHDFCSRPVPVPGSASPTATRDACPKSPTEEALIPGSPVGLCLFWTCYSCESLFLFSHFLAVHKFLLNDLPGDLHAIDRIEEPDRVDIGMSL